MHALHPECALCAAYRPNGHFPTIALLPAPRKSAATSPVGRGFNIAQAACCLWTGYQSVGIEGFCISTSALPGYPVKMELTVLKWYCADCVYRAAAMSVVVPRIWNLLWRRRRKSSYWYSDFVHFINYGGTRKGPYRICFPDICSYSFFRHQVSFRSRPFSSIRS